MAPACDGNTNKLRLCNQEASDFLRKQNMNMKLISRLLSVPLFGISAVLLCGNILATQASQMAAPEAEAHAQQAAEKARAKQVAAAQQEKEAAKEARLAEQEAQLAEAQRQVEEASRAMAEAALALAAERLGQNADMEHSRAELSRAHRALREASREVALAHRDMEAEQRQISRVRMINLGDRAVIGVLLGDASEKGVELNGVSPGGPAEQAGLKQGDVLVAVRGTDLTGKDANGAREALLSTMAEVKPGEEIRIDYVRDGNDQNLMLTAEKREPSSWQSMLRLPEPPAPPAVPGTPGEVKAPQVIVERIRVPGSDSKVVVIDEEALAAQVADIERRVENFQYMFIDEDGTRIEFDEDIHFDGDFSFDAERFSRIGENALREANMWFGMSHTAGLELASLNPELGSYFKAESGVLVLQVKEDNSYGLKAGDVIISVAGTPVTSPAELVRALREFEPGAQFELHIKRERRDKTLQATLPDSRLGALMGFGLAPEQHPKP
jgi:C-terminal processing protease CtpA/Prc